MKIAVLGAGTVGVCCALFLQRDGHQVTLIDRAEPGTGCSFGNAGIIQVGACVPVATPGVLKAAPRMLLDPEQPLVIRWQYLPSLLPYLIRFLAAASPARVEAISRVLAEILSLAWPSYQELIKQTGAEDLVRQAGELWVYETEKSYNSAQYGYGIRRSRGVKTVELSPAEIHELEPALARIFHRGIYMPDFVQTVNPYLLTKRLTEGFQRSNGTVLIESVEDVTSVGGSKWVVSTDRGKYQLDAVVVAMGAFSKRWAKFLGHSVPLNSERGYHLMLPDPGVELKVPVVSGDYRFAMVQMRGGLRLVGTAELASVHAPPNYARAERLFPMAQRMLPGLRGGGEAAWMGCRPSTPDSLPVIGRSSRFSSAYFAFGHGHLGLTLGAATGRLLADVVAERKPAIDMQAFDAGRF